MALLRERALIVFGEDVRGVELLKIIKAKIVTQMLPPHRYDCTLTVDKSLLRWKGVVKWKQVQN